MELKCSSKILSSARRVNWVFFQSGDFEKAKGPLTAAYRNSAVKDTDECKSLRSTLTIVLK